jgi:hypothetical protein
MAGSDLVSWQNPLMAMLPSILGGESDTDVQKNETATTSGTANTLGTSNQTSTGTTNQTTSGSSTQQTNADVSALQQIFAKQSAGITPEMLTAIFTEGAKKVPGLQTAYGNAVGARASDNTPLATSIRDLQGNLTNQAAVLNNQLLKDSSLTAQAIADLTKSITGTNTSTTTGTTSNTTQGTSSQTANNNSTTNTNAAQTVDQSNTVNTDVLKVLAGLGIGGSALDTILGGNGVTGGLNSLIGKVTGVVPGTLSGLLGGNSTGMDLTGTWDGLFGSGSLAKDLEEFGINWDGNFDDLMGGATDGFNFDLDSIDWTGDIGDTLAFGWADGGLVRRKGDPVVGTKGPEKKGSGGGALSTETIIDAIRKSQPPQSAASVPEGRKNLPFNTTRALKEHDEYADGGEITTAMGVGDKASQQKLAVMRALQQIAQDPRGRQLLQAKFGNARGAGQTVGSEKYTPQIGLGGYIKQRNAYVNQRLEADPIQQWQTGGYSPGDVAPDQVLTNAADWEKRRNNLVSEYEATLDPRELKAIREEMILSAQKNQKRFNRGKALTLSMIGAMAGGAAGFAANSAGANAVGSQLAKTGASQAVKYAGRSDGGIIEGPGDGISDSIPGFGPDGPIAVSDGEYIIPADVVLKKGTDFFDKLLEQNHTPAEMQRAMGA